VQVWSLWVLGDISRLNVESFLRLEMISGNNELAMQQSLNPLQAARTALL
jgi:hypothetical protein